MSYINNMNPRRMIWFNQNAPKNKMDLWLSYNQHYEDTSDDETTDPLQTTDNPSLRKCDLILKAWDCGRWIPIVGFNSTAANKIDTVEGNTLYHPAIFTGENPNDLYDAGTLGSLLSNPNFVTELEWYDVFNSSNYDWGDIFGDTNWFGDLTWSIILSGSSSYHLPWATTTQCGGILSATHPVASSAFKPIEVKFYPNVPGYYQDEQHRLCVSAKDVIELISEYYEDNPGGSTLPIDPEGLSVILLNMFRNTSSINIGADVWSESPTGPQANPRIWNVNNSNRGKFLMIKDPYPQEGDGWTLENNAIDWISIVEGNGIQITKSNGTMTISATNQGTDTWRPIQIGGTSISDNALNIAVGSGVTITTSTSSGVTTATISADSTPSPISYTAGKGIQIDSQNNTISSEILVNNNSYTPLNVALECAGSENNGWIKIDMDNGNTERLLHPFNYIIIGGGTPGIDFTFTVPEQLYYMKGNPVFIEIDLIKSNTTNTITFGQDSKWIIADGCIQMNDNTGSFKDKHVLVTIQFGIVKIEPIQDYVQQP